MKFPRTNISGVTWQPIWFHLITNVTWRGNLWLNRFVLFILWTLRRFPPQWDAFFTNENLLCESICGTFGIHQDFVWNRFRKVDTSLFNVWGHCENIVAHTIWSTSSGFRQVPFPWVNPHVYTSANFENHLWCSVQNQLNIIQIGEHHLRQRQNHKGGNWLRAAGAQNYSRMHISVRTNSCDLF